MNILIVDDELLAVESLKHNIREALGEDNDLYSYNNPIEALKFSEENIPDIVFLDIEMPAMNGVEAARKFKKISSDIMIIFVTAYNDYAMKAWEIQVDGYLLKPASADDILRVVNNIYAKRKPGTSQETKLKANCFGKFEIFFDGKPVNFKRSRAKEVLAYLICAKGAGVTTGELCGILWEENVDLMRQKTYIRQYVQSLREALDKCGAGDVVIHNRDSYSVDTSLIDCDYYRFLNGEKDIKDKYHGEFMSQYSWAEMICAELDSI